ncbi:MAG: hypothetical protein KDI55_16175 [Anaerolineae bacterium]|nr:hypothetical protein [Anaerolineae bacterium]MCB0255259.1 hypothetical protein [Anaerolineae bacterium]MCB9140632.1 hypothetical protein [Caldilineaceae bacterium]
MSGYPKSIKRLINQYHGMAYERELERELGSLERSFAEWRSGRISSSELSHRLHQFEVGPSRALYKRYNYGQKDMILAYVIVGDVLRFEEIPDELIDALQRPLAFYQMAKNKGELREPEDLSAY